MWIRKAVDAKCSGHGNSSEGRPEPNLAQGVYLPLEHPPLKYWHRQGSGHTKPGFSNEQQSGKDDGGAEPTAPSSQVQEERQQHNHTRLFCMKW